MKKTVVAVILGVLVVSVVGYDVYYILNRNKGHSGEAMADPPELVEPDDSVESAEPVDDETIRQPGGELAELAQAALGAPGSSDDAADPWADPFAADASAGFGSFDGASAGSTGPGVVVSGILLGERPLAIVGSRIVTVGDPVGDGRWKIVSIERRWVLMTCKEKTCRLLVGDSQPVQVEE